MSATHECGVCWRPYDPDAGDPDRAIPPGTGFADLPADWACPDCDAPAARFLPLAQAARPGLLRRALATAYAGVLPRMRALGLCNDRLAVDVGTPVALGAEHAVAIVLPWSVLLLLVPADGAAAAPGTEVEREFLSGAYVFTAAELAGVGRFLQLSLFSPADMFDGTEAARRAADAALAALLAVPAPPPRPAAGRRALLGMGA